MVSSGDPTENRGAPVPSPAMHEGQRAMNLNGIRIDSTSLQSFDECDPTIFVKSQKILITFENILKENALLRAEIEIIYHHHHERVGENDAKQLDDVRMVE